MAASSPDPAASAVRLFAVGAKLQVDSFASAANLATAGAPETATWSALGLATEVAQRFAEIRGGWPSAPGAAAAAPPGTLLNKPAPVG